ncbi:unnamed protein product [Urochloa humidicola]
MMLPVETMAKHHNLTLAQQRADLPGNDMNPTRQKLSIVNVDNFDGLSRSNE